MTTPIALAQARLVQATAARVAAEDELAAAMDALGLRTGGVELPTCLHFRSLEVVVEACPGGPFAATYSKYCRARNAENKAARALLHARLAPAQPARPAPKPRPRPRSRPFAEAIAMEAAW